MSRRNGRLLWLVVYFAIASTIGAPAARAQRVVQLQVPAGGGGQVVAPMNSLYLPGFWQLSQESVRNELEIVPEQIEKLQEIGKKFQTQQQELYATLRKPGLSDDERQAAYEEIQKKSVAMTEDVSKEIKEVLLPHQINRLQDIDFRNRANMMLQNPYYVDRLKLNDEQKERVKKNRDELVKKIQAAQKEALDEVLDLLTPEQLEQLKQPWQGQQFQGNKPTRENDDDE